MTFVKQVAVLFVAIVLAAAFVGVVAAPVANASPTKLSARLLDIGQMPMGWQVYKSSLDGGFGCASNVLDPKGIKQTGNADVAFDHSGGVPTVDEALATFTNAKTGYEKIEAKLMACKRFSDKVGATRTTGTVAPLKFPRYANTSAAFAMKVTVLGSTFHEDLLIARKASIVMGMDEASLPSVNADQFQGLVKKALAKLP